jgi:hypothetical protein
VLAKLGLSDFEAGEISSGNEKVDDENDDRAPI